MADKVKFKTTLNSIDKVVEITGWTILGFLWILTIWSLFILPETIPTHFNFMGKADGFGGKGTIIFLPILLTIIFIAFTKLNQYPQSFNYPVKLTHKYTEQQYANATRMIRYLKISLATAFTFIIFGIIQYAQRKTDGLGIWFLPVMITIIFLPTIYFLAKSLKDKWLND